MKSYFISDTDDDGLIELHDDEGEEEGFIVDDVDVKDDAEVAKYVCMYVWISTLSISSQH